jgi:hypothetical protein
MSKILDTTGPAARWHIDCRLVDELPEDRIVGLRFLINALFGALAFAGLLFTGWLGYLDFNTRRQTSDWEKRINDNRAEVRDLQRMKGEYAAEAAKVDEAYKLIKPQFFVSGFITTLGRMRPAQLLIDAIEWTDVTIIMRGSVRERSERASLTLGNFVKTLAKDDSMSPLFREIRLTGFDRGDSDDVINFEIAFYLKAAKP